MKSLQYENLTRGYKRRECIGIWFSEENNSDEIGAFVRNAVEIHEFVKILGFVVFLPHSGRFNSSNGKD